MNALAFALAAAKFAPSIMRFFGAGEKPTAVADGVAAIARDVTGASTPQDALAALEGNPELALKFQQAILAVDADLERAALADRQGARGRDIEVRKLDGGKNMRADAMVIGAVIGLIACLVVLVFFRKDIPGEAVGIISTIAGIFGACLRDAFQFEFGSSRGSKTKDDAILARLSGR